MTNKKLTQTRKRHLKLYHRFLKLKGDDLTNDIKRALKTSNTLYYDRIAEEEGWSTDHVRRVCNTMIKENPKD